jgi:ABC-type amino acid transport substrate-binding protein
MLPFAGMSHARSTIVEPCKKVVVSGDDQWPPYIVDEEITEHYDFDSYEAKDLSITGAGIELAAKIFSELDVKVEKTSFTDRSSMLDAVRNGKVDLIVNTYKYKMLANVADILMPAWSNDPITIAVPSEKAAHIKNWEDLVGQQGIMASNFGLDEESESYFAKYLHVKRSGALLEALQAVQSGKYAYVVGSSLQLNYAIKANQMTQSLTVVHALSRKADGVHMALSKRSACAHYATYVRKRLQDYKNNGTVQKVIEKYMQ